MELNEEQIKFLKECTTTWTNWTLNSKTGLVDIDGSFDCSKKELTDFKGVKFGRVLVDFNCSYNKLTSLEGAPQVVGGSFYCHSNKITSLEGAPQEVGKSFDCSWNNLTSLEGAPQKVRGCFDCSHNKLTSFEGAPQASHYTYSNNSYTIPNCILDLVIKTMKDKGVNYYTALFLNKEKVDKEKNKILEKLEKLENIFSEIDTRMTKGEQKAIWVAIRYGHFNKNPFFI